MVGVEGHNPSGHYLIATKIVDYVPLSVSDDDNSRQTKRQAVDQDNHPADSSDTPPDLSLVCKLVIHETRFIILKWNYFLNVIRISLILCTCHLD